MKLLTATIFKQLRNCSGRTQGELAKLADVSLRTYQNWENGDTTPPLHIYVLLCMKLSIEPARLIPSLSTLRRGGEQAGIQEIDKVENRDSE
ncbi:helix-turn-helix transcriptional regulator [Pseudoalteromonas sp. Of7M-16]|uniref:helix-turn-helix domain-containing protein n=1 Tax=Pseudoalteromonas sp. Of7M-16 TaxID=2917756 RepID=UPI001EF47431|nr:helix-turn-helix domain-containing protein [Pseudoalteromonas sp. Of7M-16]